LLRSRREKSKKRREERDENLHRVKRQNGGKMKRRNTKRRQQQNCDVAKVIDTIEKAAETAMKIYRIVKAILRNGRKAK